MIDVGFVPKVYVNLNEESDVFFEVDPAFSMDVWYFLSESGADPHFTMTFGTGILIKNVVFGFKFKTMFLEYVNAKWVNFYVGYSGS